MADFFDKKEEEKTVDETPKEEPKEPGKVKVGEKEYEQEELSRIVGLGELASELEGKWNTKVDRLYPEFTKATQEREELKKRVDEFEDAKVKEKVTAGEELTPEETQKQVLAQADNLGIVHKDNVYKFIDAYLQARDMKEDAEALIAEAEENGKPKTTIEEIFKYMDESGIKNVELAYKAKFEKELDTWKETQLEKIKNGEIKTLDASSAGSKEPEPSKISNLDSLTDAMKSYFNRGA